MWKLALVSGAHIYFRSFLRNWRKAVGYCDITEFQLNIKKFRCESVPDIFLSQFPQQKISTFQTVLLWVQLSCTALEIEKFGCTNFRGEYVPCAADLGQ